MRRTSTKKIKNRKINQMSKATLTEFIKDLEKDNQVNSKVYAMAKNQLLNK